ncbi:MAG: septum formation initiator family protein [Candidatus Berkelbacteria bacterium]
MLKKIKEGIERIIPMSLTSLFLFAVVVYMMIIVGKTVLANYAANGETDKEEAKLAQMEADIAYMEDQNNYYQTQSYKEKEARAKLGYKATGESVLSLPIDTPEEKISDSGVVEQKITVPNYRLWWEYFTKK